MLRNESEQMSEKISKDGRKVLEDMTLYIRGVDISVYDQERVRRDITQMILDGEQRGDPASSVIGEDYSDRRRLQGFLRQCAGRDTEAYCRSEGYDDHS